MQRKIILTILAISTAAFLLHYPILKGSAENVSSLQPTQLAVVDMEKVFNNYEKTKQINKQIAARQEEIKTQIRQKVERIEALKSELQNFHPDSKEFYEREKQLFKLSVELDSYKRISAEDMKREFKAATEQIYNEILDTIKTIAESEGYDIVLYLDTVTIEADSFPALLEKIRQRKVLYASKQIDITDKVLNHLNQQYRLKGN